MLSPFGQGSGLIVHSRQPYNAEPPPDRLRASFIMPNEAFYVRSHGPIPKLDAATHRLRIGGMWRPRSTSRCRICNTVSRRVGRTRWCPLSLLGLRTD